MWCFLGNTKERELEYVDNIIAVASDPDAYAGKYIRFSGIASVTNESDEAYGLQVYGTPITIIVC